MQSVISLSFAQRTATPASKLSAHRVCCTEVIDAADDVTLSLMREMVAKHGPGAWNSVRAGKWTKLDMGRPAEL